ncbi:hypothetical protein IT570_14690 [Candidatus Sumerlaeota bacterium]|nr:hypothetical protein [Candidatus Sumerlaeota bacterium]
MTAPVESAKDISRLQLGRWSTLADGESLRLDASLSFLPGFAAIPANIAARISILDLRNQPLPLHLAQWLASLPNLHTITLAGCALTNEDVHALCASPSIRAIDLSSTPITSEALERIGELKTLRSLILSRTLVDDEAAPFLAKLPHLEALRLGQTRITDEAAPALAEIRTLREFEPPLQFGDDSLHLFKNHPFVSLWLANTHVTDHAFDPFPESDSLAFVALPDSFGEEGSRTLIRFRNLSTLWLESTTLTREVFEALGGQPKLTTLFITAPLQDEAMRALSHLPTLQRLCLLAPRSTRFHLELLGSSPALRELRIDASQLDDHDVWLFSTLKNLTRLHIENSCLSAAAIVELRDRLPNVHMTHPARVCTLATPMLKGELLQRPFTSSGDGIWSRCRWEGATFTFAPDHELSFRAQLMDDFPQFEWLAKLAGRYFVELKFDTCTLAQSLIQNFSCFTLLASLELRACTYHASIFSVIDGMKRLQKIVLDFTDFDDLAAERVSACVSLTEIHARKTLLTENGARILAAMPNVRRLLLEGCEITVDQLAMLKSSHPHVEFSQIKTSG